MIVYGVLTDTSIPKLYLAGFIPASVLAGLFQPDGGRPFCVISHRSAATPTPGDVGRSAIAALPDSCRLLLAADHASWP